VSSLFCGTVVVALSVKRLARECFQNSFEDIRIFRAKTIERGRA